MKAAVLLLALLACSEPSVPDASLSDSQQVLASGDLSLNRKDWTYTGNPLQWSNDASGALTFVFPSKQTVNYTYEWVKVPKVIYDSLTATITITVLTGTPVFHFDASQPANCTMKPFVVLFMSSNWSSASGGNGDDDRWWAFADKVTLAPGPITLTARIDPARWLNVNGQTGDTRPAQFQSATRNINGLGLTYGGGCYYGHGVFTTGGTARMAITHLEAA